jgi:two-component system sensor kinase FixL
VYGTQADASTTRGVVVDIDGQAQVLQTIAKAVQIIAAQVSIDGVATALLNASLDLSGAARGAAVLAAKGALLLGESGFEPGVPLVALHGDYDSLEVAG